MLRRKFIWYLLPTSGLDLFRNGYILHLVFVKFASYGWLLFCPFIAAFCGKALLLRFHICMCCQVVLGSILSSNCVSIILSPGRVFQPSERLPIRHLSDVAVHPRYNCHFLVKVLMRGRNFSVTVSQPFYVNF